MLIKNGKIITLGTDNEILENQALYIKDGVIVDIASEDDLRKKYSPANVLDANGQYIMPGNICAHTHFYGAYARGMAIPGSAPKDFPEILRKLWWPLDLALNEDGVRYSALVMLIDAIKNGTTTLIDHHASPNFIDGSLDVIADAVDQSGLRAVLCYEVTDRNGVEGAQEGIHENVRFINRVNSERVANGRIGAMFGLHASMTLTDETLAQAKQAIPANAGFHIHAAEHESDEYDSLGKSGLRVIDRLSGFGILGPKSIVAHAIHIDSQEATLLAETNTRVTHQPRSNMNNGVGVAPVESLIRLGIPVGIGTDGFSHTMWAEWKTAYLLHKLANRDPRRMDGYTLMNMGTRTNAQIANQFFGDTPVGSIQVGNAADLNFVDYKHFTPLDTGNLPWQILFGFNESMITTTIVQGQVLMKDRKIMVLDEDEIFSAALEHAPIIWEQYQKNIIEN